MARLIDADKLKSDIACHKQYTDQKYKSDRQWAIGYNAGIERALFNITYARTIEAEPVVHCKDCKSFKEYTPGFKASAECVEGADGDCITRLLYSDAHPQFSAVKKCDYCSFGAKMDLEG